MRNVKLMALAVAALSTTALSGMAAAQTLKFEPVKAPVTNEEKRAVLASSKVTVAGRTYEIGYTTLARSGDKLGDGTFGLLLDEKGNPVKTADGAEEIATSADFSTLLPIGDKLYNVTHFESRPGAMYLTELEQDPTTGKLTAVSTKPVDFSGVGGIWVPCAGSRTPWNTHLGSEEYPPNARAIEEAASMDDIDDYWKPFTRYFGLDSFSKDTSPDDFRKVFNPYQYGYATEVEVTSGGDAKVTKHYAIGRSAFELAYVMPDRRTVYFSDDGTNVGFYMFVADVPGQLTAGHTYAAKWHQISDENGGKAKLSWVDLGHATYDEVEALIKAGTTFSDIFETAKPNDDNSCPDGFTSVNTTDGHECLKVKEGMEVAASRLETRRYAAMLGATTEFRKEEGITFNADDDVLYVAMSAVARGMEDFAKGGKSNDKYDKGGNNDIRLPYNKCGTVYALNVDYDEEIGSDYVAMDMEGLVSGVPHTYEEGHEYAGNKCHIDGIANPDNVTYITGYNTLIIGEDTGSGHQNDVIWSYNLDDESLTRIQTTPYGSETTSPYFYHNVGGYAYLMSVIQHPYGESDEDKATGPEDKRAYVGYIGPFPQMD